MFTQENKYKLSTNYKFIVVYDKFTKPVANWLKNQAMEKSISSVSWSEKDYLHNEVNLTNDNHVVFLSEKLIKENLSAPSIVSYALKDGARYKKHGHATGIYLEDIDYTEAAKRIGKSLKEDWGKELVAIIGGGVLGAGLLAAFRYWTKSKKAQLYLLFKAAEEYSKEPLDKFVMGENYVAQE